MFKNSIVEKFKDEYKIKDEEDIKHIAMLADLVNMEFDGKDKADDDFVNPEIRDVLYQLEAMDLLKMDITEKHIVDGRVWKKHFWVMNHREVERINNGGCMKERNCIESDSSEIYQKLPDEIWRSRNRDNFLGAA